MTHQEYLEMNKLGFEGDLLLKKQFGKLIEEHKVSTVVETGTFKGSTTVQLSTMADRVHTVEASPEFFAEAAVKFEGKDNITNHLGSSVDVLPGLIPAIKDENIFFFLDAHWGPNNPLLQELSIIAEAGLKPVIAIHDFKVPEHPELGFDSYDGQDYEWSWIEKGIESIYGKDGYTHFYNTEAEGMKRGVVFITPKNN